MQPDSRTPISVVICIALVRLAARLIPRENRVTWTEERTAEVWHRWQFLFHSRAWTPFEALRLLRNCSGAFPAAISHLISQHQIRGRVRGCIRSPWTCLIGLIIFLIVLSTAMSGFPATRQLLTSCWQRNSGRILFIWRHPVIGGGDRGLPPDLVTRWAEHSRLTESVAGFNVTNTRLMMPAKRSLTPLVVTADTRLFETLQVHPIIGSLSKPPGVALDYPTWVALFHADPKAIGSQVRIGSCSLRVISVLPPNLFFITRHPAVYLIQQAMTDRRVMVVARARKDATKTKIDRELTNIGEDAGYFYRSQLRLRFLDRVILAPLASFAVGVFIAIVIVLVVCGIRIRYVRIAFNPQNRHGAMRRACFFLAKLMLALLILFIAGLEWSRSESSLMFGSRDPGSGPFLVWLYIAGSMAVFFWCVADQRARCRVCLRLLCFPVRIGCPGCLLLDWSGTEFLCAEGHGLLHVPLLAPSWDEKSEHWITLDESWRELFADTR